MVAGYKQTNSQRKLLYVLSASLMLITIVAVSVNAILWSKYVSTSAELTTLKTGVQKRIWQIGENIETAEFVFSVNEVNVNQQGLEKYLPAPEGMQFVTVDVSMRNKTAEEKVFIPLNTAYIRDSEGNKYELTVSPDVDSSAAGRIAAGDIIKGQIGFLVPESSMGLNFYLEPFGATSDIIIVSLNGG